MIVPLSQPELDEIVHPIQGAPSRPVWQKPVWTDFPGSTHARDFLEINRFLLDPARVEVELDALELAARTALDGLVSILEPTKAPVLDAAIDTAILAPMPGSVPPRRYRYHLLSTVLAQYEEPMPVPARTETRTTMLAAQGKDAFLAFMRNGQHFKDPYITPAHGEYTHRIQWWMLSNAQSKGRIALTVPVATLYKEIADFPSEIGTIKDDPAIGPHGDGLRFEWTLWLALVDRLPFSNTRRGQLIGERADYRGPVQLNTRIAKPLSTQKVWPVLRAILLDKWQRRQAEVDRFNGDTFSSDVDEVQIDVPSTGARIRRKKVTVTKLLDATVVYYLMEKFFPASVAANAPALKANFDLLPPQHKEWLAKKASGTDLQLLAGEKPPP